MQSFSTFTSELTRQRYLPLLCAMPRSVGFRKTQIAATANQTHVWKLVFDALRRIMPLEALSTTMISIG